MPAEQDFDLRTYGHGRLLGIAWRNARATQQQVKWLRELRDKSDESGWAAYFDERLSPPFEGPAEMLYRTLHQDAPYDRETAVEFWCEMAHDCGKGLLVSGDVIRGFADGALI